MRLSVDHVTTYSYDAPVRGVVQSHRLHPTQCQNQRVLSWSAKMEGAIEGARFRDGAGDIVTGWSLRGPVREITIRVQGIVETQDLAGVLRGHRESIPSVAWLGETEATATDAALQALAAEGAGSDALALAHDLSRLVADAVVFERGATEATTTAAEALARGRGVCQDHAQVLIACARARDLPARYVSGYLFSGEAAGQAAHAWAEIWIEGLGWVGFDAANRCCPDERHIRLGCGADAQAAAPIRGLSRGRAVEHLQIAVAIGATQQ